MKAALKDVRHRGYAVLPGWLPPRWGQRLIDGLDRLAVDAPGQKRLMPHAPFLDALAGGLFDDLVRPVLGTGYRFHHANGKRVRAGDGKVWHHDFDGDHPWDGNPASMMVHVMVYPGGLAEQGGPLVVRPGSQRTGVPRHHPNRLGYEVEPGDEVLTGGPGLVVVLNSALWHMRPPHTSSELRYYLNYSFIGPAEVGRPEREEYAALLAGLPAAVPAGPGRDRISALAR